MFDGKDILSISYLRYVHIGILSNQEYKYVKPKMLSRLLSLKNLKVYGRSLKFLMNLTDV
jgi:HKD family nuclease